MKSEGLCAGTGAGTVSGMSYAVKAENYRTCICGRVCKGRSALSTHARACALAQVRSALSVYCAAESLPHMGDQWVVENFGQLRAALADLPVGHPAAGMVR